MTLRSSTTTARPIRVGVVGTAWRADFFLRLAAQLGERFELVGVTARSAESVERAAETYRTTGYATPAELVRGGRPEVVVVCVPWGANAAVITELALLGVHVLAETPPAVDADGLRSLWAALAAARATDRVQIAEQYLLLPGHAARRELVRRGAIGTPTSVQVSSTHTYHAVSIMRGMLGAGFGPVTVRASATTGPLVDPLDRDGWTLDRTEKPASTIIATLDFAGTEAGAADGAHLGTGVYDFTDNQWHNQLRHRRIVVRGSRGEIVDDAVVHLGRDSDTDAQPTLLRSRLERRRLGEDLNLDGHDTELISFEGDVVWRNPYLGERLMDEEIAIAAILEATGRHARGDGEAPYPLAEAAQDHLVGLAIDAALAADAPVTTAVEAWGR